MTLRERAIALAQRLNIAADERDIDEIERELDAVADEEFEAGFIRAVHERRFRPGESFARELTEGLMWRRGCRRST
jgi:hypothetical protein